MELSKEETYTSWNRQFTFKEASSFNKNALKMQRKNNGLALLLIKGKELVGKADLRLREGRQDHIGDLGIFIKKEYRGVGFGSILMESILVSSKKYLMNLRIISLGVYEENTGAIKLYKKFGVTQYGKLPSAYFMRGKYKNSIAMYIKV